MHGRVWALLQPATVQTSSAGEICAPSFGGANQQRGKFAWDIVFLRQKTVRRSPQHFIFHHYIKGETLTMGERSYTQGKQ
jgi:hypothetical protein